MADDRKRRFSEDSDKTFLFGDYIDPEDALPKDGKGMDPVEDDNEDEEED